MIGGASALLSPMQTPDFKAVLDMRQRRLDICAKCEHVTRPFGFDVCGLCKCPLAGKATLPLAKCPADKWIK